MKLGEKGVGEKGLGDRGEEGENEGEAPGEKMGEKEGELVTCWSMLVPGVHQLSMLPGCDNHTHRHPRC